MDRDSEIPPTGIVSSQWDIVRIRIFCKSSNSENPDSDNIPLTADNSCRRDLRIPTPDYNPSTEIPPTGIVSSQWDIVRIRIFRIRGFTG